MSTRQAEFDRSVRELGKSLLRLTSEISVALESLPVRVFLPAKLRSALSDRLDEWRAVALCWSTYSTRYTSTEKTSQAARMPSGGIVCGAPWRPFETLPSA